MELAGIVIMASIVYEDFINEFNLSHAKRLQTEQLIMHRDGLGKGQAGINNGFGHCHAAANERIADQILEETIFRTMGFHK